MKSLYTSLNTAHSNCKPSTSMSLSTHSFQLSLPFPLLTSRPCHLHHWGRYPIIHTPMLPDAQTISICHASLHPPHSVHPENCSNPHCLSYPSATPYISISPSSVPSSPEPIWYGFSRVLRSFKVMWVVGSRSFQSFSRSCESLDHGHWFKIIWIIDSRACGLWDICDIFILSFDSILRWRWKKLIRVGSTVITFVRHTTAEE